MKEITLEMSLKPFKINTYEEIVKVCRKLFTQWLPLARNAEGICVMLWTGDGSELLAYSGNHKDEVEWGKYIGRANECSGDWNKATDPSKLSPHAQRYLYAEEPPVFCYEDLRNIVKILKQVGREVTGKKIRIGTTFDPGPEFAVSKFKYVDHPEVCTAGTMGAKSFVVSYEVLKEDHKKYSSYPNGIPEGTPFALFFGKQCQAFMQAMEFDYIWFSNGFGFGAENWATTGPLFDGKIFTMDTQKVENIKQKTLRFWKQFREGCPNYEVQTRGTNLSVGIDFATDGVDAKDIYRGNFHIVPPPNSPWAALDKNFGLEMTGYMSRISEIPNDKNYMYRFYLHDPWWMNSPWFDRYEGEPHDIYLPLAVARINRKLMVENPSYLNLLTVDTSLGALPEEAVQSVTPHIDKALHEYPDKPGLLVWAYPFDEYQSMTDDKQYTLTKSFFEDWYITSAINQGLPLHTVISTTAFAENQEACNVYFKGSIILTPVPRKGSVFEKSLLAFVENGGDVLLYGSLRNAGEGLLRKIGIEITEGIDGIVTFIDQSLHTYKGEYITDKLFHDANLSDGCFDTILRKDATVDILCKVQQENKERITGILCNDGGNLVWLRGTNCNESKEGLNLLQPHDNQKFLHDEILLRHALQVFGYHIEFLKHDVTSKVPALTIHRHDNAFMFSGYVPDTTVGLRMKFPLGVPVLIGHEVHIKDGYGHYNFPRSFHRECRVFVQQEKTGIISMIEYGPVSIIMKRRVVLEGLKDAIIYVFPEEGKEAKCELLLNSEKPNIVGEPFMYELVTTKWGNAYRAEHVSGSVMYSMEFDHMDYLEKGRIKN